MKPNKKLFSMVAALLSLALAAMMAGACLPDDGDDTGTKEAPEGTVHTFPKE